MGVIDYTEQYLNSTPKQIHVSPQCSSRSSAPNVQPQGNNTNKYTPISLFHLFSDWLDNVARLAPCHLFCFPIFFSSHTEWTASELFRGICWISRKKLIGLVLLNAPLKNSVYVCVEIIEKEEEEQQQHQQHIPSFGKTFLRMLGG